VLVLEVRIALEHRKRLVACDAGRIGASETAVPSIEEVKTVIDLAIKYGKAPAPTLGKK